MVRIHCPYLAAVIPCFVRLLVVHVVRDPDLGEYQWMISHISQAFVPKEFELITQAISNCSFTDLDGKGRSEILPTEDAYHINVVEPIPVMVRSGLKRWGIPTHQRLVKSVSPS